MNPILSFLQDGQLPVGTDKARKVKKRAARFILNDTQYKRGFSMPYLRCVEEDEAKCILEEAYEGICKDHTGPKSLVSKIIRTGYYWPTMQKDAKEYEEKCDKCQRFRNVQRVPKEKMMTITSQDTHKPKVKTRNQEPIFFTKTPTSQQSDGSDKSNVVEDH